MYQNLPKHLLQGTAIVFFQFCTLTQASAQIDELIVRVEKRDTAAQTTGAAFTAFSGEALKTLGVTNAIDLQLVTPGLVMSDTGPDARVFVRGIGTDVVLTGVDTSVAVYTDGAFLARAAQLKFDLLDVERVEVLKGPQGTLYGRNATGGAINVTTNQPTNDFEAYLDAGYGNLDTVRVSGAVNVPAIEDKLLFRLAAQVNQRDGWTKNLASGADEDRLDGEDAWMGRGLVRILPSDDIDILLGVEYLQSDPSTDGFQTDLETTDPAVGITNAPFFSGGTLGSEDSRFVYHNFTDPHSIEELAFRGKMDWDLSDSISLSLNASFRDFDSEFNADTDLSELPLTTVTQLQDSETLTAEATVTFDPTEEFSLTAGVFYFDDQVDDACPCANGISLRFTSYRLFEHCLCCFCTSRPVCDREAQTCSGSSLFFRGERLRNC